jgi:hypothetical protein
MFRFRTGFSATFYRVLNSRFFSAAKKDFIEEMKNGHAINVQNQKVKGFYKKGV